MENTTSHFIELVVALLLVCVLLLGASQLQIAGSGLFDKYNGTVEARENLQEYREFAAYETGNRVRGAEAISVILKYMDSEVSIVIDNGGQVAPPPPAAPVGDPFTEPEVIAGLNGLQRYNGEVVTLPGSTATVFRWFTQSAPPTDFVRGINRAPGAPLTPVNDQNKISINDYSAERLQTAIPPSATYETTLIRDTNGRAAQITFTRIHRRQP